MHPCAGQPSRSEKPGRPDASHRPPQRRLTLTLPNSPARHRTRGGSVHRRLSAAATPACSVSAVQRQINALRPATAGSRNCSLQTCRSDLVLNVSKVASTSPTGTPALGQEPSSATGRLRAARRCRHHPSRAPGARSQRTTRRGSNVPCGERRCTKTIGPSSTKTSASPSPFTSLVASQSPSAPALRTKSGRLRLRDHTGIAGNPARGAGQAACAPAPSSIELRPHRRACCATSIAAAVAGATYSLCLPAVRARRMKEMSHGQ